jgi:hypothetical protein
MAIVTISDLTADEKTKLEFAKRLKASATPQDLVDGTKYAVVLLKLAPAVTPADYATLKTDIIGVTGIQDATLLIDHETRASVPANHVQVLDVRADVTLRDDTPE